MITMMACESVPKKRMEVITLVRRENALSDLQLICPFEAPSKAWFQEQEEYARRQTSSAAPEDGNFKPVPVVNKVPGTFLSVGPSIDHRTDPSQYPRYVQR